jgi:hypothetical protein
LPNAEEHAFVIGFLALLLSLVAGGQASPIVQRGTWTATVGPSTAQVMRGSWSAETTSATPNAARGSWTLLNANNEIALEGTWSAMKSSSGGWQGTWSARAVTRLPSGRSTPGRVFSGTWQLTTEVNGKTLGEMFQRTLEAEVAGSWRSAGLTGNWWLRGGRR